MTTRGGEINRIRRRLQTLDQERAKLEEELDALLQTSEVPLSTPAPSASGSVSAADPAPRKIALFRKLFSGRTDVFPVRCDPDS